LPGIEPFAAAVGEKKREAFGVWLRPGDVIGIEVEPFLPVAGLSGFKESVEPAGAAE
jgi:hypothetical protein